MSMQPSQTPPLSRGSQKAGNAEDSVAILEGIVSNISRIVDTVNIQILGNADIIPHNFENGPSREACAMVVENMIKSPIRIQVGKLIRIRNEIRESLRYLKHPSTSSEKDKSP